MRNRVQVHADRHEISPCHCFQVEGPPRPLGDCIYRPSRCVGDRPTKGRSSGNAEMLDGASRRGRVRPLDNRQVGREFERVGLVVERPVAIVVGEGCL